MIIITGHGPENGSRAGRMGRSMSMAAGLAAAGGSQGCWSMAI
jgi:hypothetical protein